MHNLVAEITLTPATIQAALTGTMAAVSVPVAVVVALVVVGHVGKERHQRHGPATRVGIFAIRNRLDVAS